MSWASKLFRNVYKEKGGKRKSKPHRSRSKTPRPQIKRSRIKAVRHQTSKQKRETELKRDIVESLQRLDPRLDVEKLMWAARK